MDKKESEFLKRLLKTFRIEAKEHLDTMSSGILELEKSPSAEKRMEIIEHMFREAHSLKGAARAVNLVNIGSVCQSLEGVFAALKRQEISLSAQLFNVLYQTLDILTGLSGETEQTGAERPPVAKLINELENIAHGGTEPLQREVVREEVKKEEKPCVISKPEVHKPLDMEKSIPAEVIKVSTKKLYALLLQSEEMLSAKLMTIQRAADVRDIIVMLEQWKKEFARVLPDVRFKKNAQNSNRRLRHRGEKTTSSSGDLTSTGGNEGPVSDRLIEFLDWNYIYLQSLENKLKTVSRFIEQDKRSFGIMVNNVLTDTKKLLMIPFSSVFESFPRFVREIAKEQGKKTEFVIQGGDIEIDRRVLDEMKDPLMHLVRNCIDHGIEKSEVREQKKKPHQGTITVAISQKDSNKVEILISDDGAGIDRVKVRNAALKLGVISPKDADTLSEQDILSLVFKSGVSTSPIITDISGRGIGLAIVKEKIEKSGGIVFLETHPDAGTMFRIILPMTLATFFGVLVQVEEQPFVIPTINVEQVVRVREDEIKTVENRETIQIDGRIVSLARLSAVLEFSRKAKKEKNSGYIIAVILFSSDKRIAFVVDKVLGEQEVLVKNLGKQLFRVRNIAGATVLGNGKIVPILNVPDVLQSATKISGYPVKISVREGVGKEEKKSILVVEDSITSRMLLKNILETAGYQVKVAVDGMDAFTALRTEDVDLVVSDVDMPRMNGFDLTTKIRGDTKLAEMPVVLVTALDSREDRERGIDVGANAYIVKSSFDQSNLLEVVKRLI